MARDDVNTLFLKTETSTHTRKFQRAHHAAVMANPTAKPPPGRPPPPPARLCRRIPQVECEKWWALDEVHKQSNAKLARILRKKDELNERLEALTKQPAELRTVQRICNALNADLKAAQKERAECSAKLEVHLAELSENVSKHNDRLNRELPALQRGRTKFEAQAKRMQAELENFQKVRGRLFLDSEWGITGGAQAQTPTPPPPPPPPHPPPPTPGGPKR